MRKLTPEEQAALFFLERDGAFCPGDRINTPAGQILKAALDGLVRKKRAIVAMTDDGPLYHAAS